MQSGSLYTRLRLVTARETLRIPRVAQWVESVPEARDDTPPMPLDGELGAISVQDFSTGDNQGLIASMGA